MGQQADCRAACCIGYQWAAKSLEEMEAAVDAEVARTRRQEEATIEAQQLFTQHRREVADIATQTFEQGGEAAGGNQPDILGKYGEEAALEEVADPLRRVSRRLQRLGEAGKFVGNDAGRLGAALGRIEGVGFGPDLAQQGANLGIEEIERKSW